jgi:cytoskeletal protein RodZ
MENLMNKVANDLKNFAPQAPAGMEERIQKALIKKKSFWTFSWYTMNVYVVGLLGIGAIAWMLSNKATKVEVAQLNAPQVNNEVSIQPAPEVKNVQSNVPVINSSQKSVKSTSEEMHPITQITQAEPEPTQDYREVPAEPTVTVQPEVEVADKIEIQKMPEEIQVPKVKSEGIKPKGRTLKLTRLTGK